MKELQHDLGASELLLEYVLADPESYVLAVTMNAVRRYTLPSKLLLEEQSLQYRSVLIDPQD